MSTLATFVRSPASRLTLAIGGLLGAAPAQFTPKAPLVSGIKAPFAISLGNTAGLPQLEIATAHWWPAAFFPTGVDSYSPGVGKCAPFGAAVAQTFTTVPTGFPTTIAFDVAVADINHIGLLETCTLVVDTITPYVEVMPLGTVLALPPISPIQMLAVDFDDDTWVDILVLDTTGKVWLSKNTTGVMGPFGITPVPAPAAPIGGVAMRFAHGSFDNDNYPDLVVTWSGPVPQATVLRNNAGLLLTSFAALVPFPLTTVPGCLTVGDFDRDGADDFVVLDGSVISFAGSNKGWVCLNSRAGPWPTSANIVANPLGPLGGAFDWPTAVTNGDYDCDGDLDLVYTSTDGNLYFRPNDGTGTFPNVFPHLQVAWPTGSTAISDLETGDIDLDGDLDVVACDWGPAGACRMWCNDLDPGECVHEFRAGLPDGILPLDKACPRNQVVLKFGGAFLKDFDVIGGGKIMAHTIDGLPSRIKSAKLTITWAPPGGLGDRFYFDVDGFGTFAQSYLEDTLLPTFTLDLGNLPGGQSLLPHLSKVGYLDIAGGFITHIDSMLLEVVSYCKETTPVVDYWHTDLKASGGVLQFTIDAPAFPYASGIGGIVFGGSTGWPGFPSPYDGVCLMPSYSMTLIGLLDVVGDMTLAVPLPVLPTCLDLHSQAIAISSAWDYGFSNTISDYTK